MGFNITECSPIPTIGDSVPQTPVRSGTNTPVLTSTPRPVGGSHLQSSDPIPNEENAHMYNLFTGIAGQVEPQKLTRLESNNKSVGSDNSALTGNTTLFYPDEIPSKNQGMSTSPWEHVESKTVQTDKTKGTSGTQTSQPDTLGNTMSLSSQQNQGKGGKKKSSQNAHTNTQPQPSTSNGGTKPALAFQTRNPGTGRPHVQCSACGSYDHFRKDCHQDNFCTRCRSKSHATHMCRHQ